MPGFILTLKNQTPCKWSQGISLKKKKVLSKGERSRSLFNKLDNLPS